MAKPEWGKKRVCQSCTAKYYDLQKEPPTCPKCGTVFQVETTTRTRRNRSAEAEKPVPKAAVIAVEDDVGVDEIAEDNVLDDDDDEEALPEDTSDLGEDDDVAGVIDTVDPEREDG